MQSDYVLRASKSALRHPAQSVERLRGRLDARADRRELVRAGGPTTVDPVCDPLSALHDMLGVAWPCAESELFPRLWGDVVAELEAGGARVGLASYRGWNDGDPLMSAAVWCAVAHLRPDTVVETGVAHGLTSRVVLEGLERNASGRLFSIDLPAVDPALHGEIGRAVPPGLTSRWDYLAGTSRQRLPALLAEHPGVELFIHDSLHTARNTRFELDEVWPVLRPGGVVVVDDIHRSTGFRSFVDELHPPAWFAARHDLGPGLWGAAIRGTYAI